MAQYVYGKNVVAQLLEGHRRIYRLLVVSGSTDEAMVKTARAKGIAVTYLTKKEMDGLVKGRHQGYIAEVEPYRYYRLDAIIDGIPKGKKPLLVILDGLEDPHNLGAVLRTCDAVGVDGVIIMKQRSVSLNDTVAKVSCGAIDTVKVAQVTNLTTTIKELRKQGFWIYGADNEEAQDYRKASYDVPLALVVGSEGRGISRLVKDNLDYRVKLPMVGQMSSLNASVATGVMLYHIYDQRHPLQ